MGEWDKQQRDGIGKPDGMGRDGTDGDHERERGLEGDLKEREGAIRRKKALNET